MRARFLLLKRVTRTLECAQLANRSCMLHEKITPVGPAADLRRPGIVQAELKYQCPKKHSQLTPGSDSSSGSDSSVPGAPSSGVSIRATVVSTSRKPGSTRLGSWNSHERSTCIRTNLSARSQLSKWTQHIHSLINAHKPSTRSLMPSLTLTA